MAQTHATAVAPRRKDEGRVLPHNLEAEASILGGILLQPTVLDRIDSLEPGQFYDHRHKVVFSAIRNLEQRGDPIDVVTVEAEIAKTGKLDAVGGAAFLGELAISVPTVDNVVAYAKIVRDHHLLRELMLKAGSIVEHGYNFADDPDELLGETIADLQRLERGYREASERVPIISVGMAMEELAKLAQTPVYETPFPELNQVLGFGGLLSGQLYYLAGGTGFGKTSWVGSLVKHHTSRGSFALIAFWEMFAGYYCSRMAAGVLGVHSNEILRGRVAYGEVLRALPPQIEFLDSPSMQMLRRAVDLHTRRGRPPPLIIVDYLQLLADHLMATMARPDPRLATALASAGLRSLAKETGAAIVVVSAASRSTGKKLTLDVRKTPPRDLIDAARESGATEYDGAGVIVLSVSDDKDGEENVATITVAKARFGETAHLDARYDGRTGSWREIGRVHMVPKGSAAAEVSTTSNSVREAIYRVLRKAGPQSSKAAIVRLSGKAKAAVLSEVDAMIDEGSLCFTAGKISITGAAPPVAEPTSQPSLRGIKQ